MHSSRKKLAIIGTVILLILAMLVYIDPFFLLQDTQEQQRIIRQRLTDPKRNDTSQAGEKVVLTVGEEKIYQKDYQAELLYAPDTTKVIREVILDKLITDSITLQGAQADGLIQLDTTVFNSPDKEYTKRIAVVKEAETRIQKSAESISGVIITVWFFNNEYISPLGYEESKQFAYNKISSMYTRVKNNEISIDTAAAMLKNDSSLEQIDRAYPNNTSIRFEDVTRDQQITFDQQFNAALWNLEEGAFSEIFTIKDKQNHTGESRDALYAFGQVTKKNGTNAVSNFASWLSKKRTLYKITYE